MAHCGPNTAEISQEVRLNCCRRLVMVRAANGPPLALLRSDHEGTSTYLISLSGTILDATLQAPIPTEYAIARSDMDTRRTTRDVVSDASL